MTNVQTQAGAILKLPTGTLMSKPKVQWNTPDERPADNPKA